MLLYRSLTIGLLGASVMLLAYETPAPHDPPGVISRASPSPRGLERATLVDVSAGVPGETIASLIRLESDEHVTMVDDQRVDGDLAAGAAIARPRHGGYIDLLVTRSADQPDLASTRRVLVLLH